MTEQKTKPAAKISQKAKLITLSASITSAINGVGITGVKPFGAKFHIIADSMGVRVPVQEDHEQVLHYVKEDMIISKIMTYCHITNNARGLHSIDQEDATKIMKFWKAYTTPIDATFVKSVANKSEKTLCWHRLPWDINGSNAPTPLFDELISRIATNQPQLLAWIGSLLVEDADRQTYVWLHGEGRNGKGRLIYLLEQVFGPSYSSQTAPERGEQRFFNAGLLGKRLVVFPDCNNYTFPTSGLFKSLTGGDAQRIERKGRDVFTAHIQARYLFSSNTAPHISGSTADTRRAIYAEIEGIGRGTKIIPTGRYNQLLWAEGPAILSKCLAKYKELCPNHEPIEPDREGTLGLVEDNEQEYTVFCKKNFIFSGEATISAPEIQDAMARHGWKNAHAQRPLLAYLMRRGVTKVMSREGEIRTRSYKGVRLNETARGVAEQY